jgi:oligopeptide/dipeptide ABC transporter ATP-binding protein
MGVVAEMTQRVAVMYAGRIVEEGTRGEVLAHARHPYTQALLRSIPALAQRGARLAEIPGTVPSPGDWPAGCRFAPRCPRAMEACREREPEATRLSPTHVARCFAVAQDLAS